MNYNEIISDVCIYGLEESIKASKYPMIVDVDKATTEVVKINEFGLLAFEQLSSPLELRIWNQDNTAMQERVISVSLTSDSDFVANWTLDEATMTYTQSRQNE